MVNAGTYEAGLTSRRDTAQAGKHKGLRPGKREALAMRTESRQTTAACRLTRLKGENTDRDEREEVEEAGPETETD